MPGFDGPIVATDTPAVDLVGAMDPGGIIRVVGTIGGPLLVATAVLALGEGLVRASDWGFEVTFASLRQTLTPDPLLGRVPATIRVATSGAVPLGAFVGGYLAIAIGLRGTVLVGAAGVLLAFLQSCLA